MKPILLGLSNPHSTDPRDALSANPKNCTGWRLWKMLHDRTGATKVQYEKAFDRRNVCDGYDFYCGATIVILGEEVRKRLIPLVPKLLIHPQDVNGVTVRQIPHPSGRCLFYNDPVQRELVAMLLEDLYEGTKQ